MMILLPSIVMMTRKGYPSPTWSACLRVHLESYPHGQLRILQNGIYVSEHGTDMYVHIHAFMYMYVHVYTCT